MGNQIGSCCRLGQGQPRVIINIDFVEHESSMVHAKFQDPLTYESEEYKSITNPSKAAFLLWFCLMLVVSIARGTM